MSYSNYILDMRATKQALFRFTALQEIEEIANLSRIAGMSCMQAPIYVLTHRIAVLRLCLITMSRCILLCAT